MPTIRNLEREFADRLAFDHYLRTGERLSREEWCSRYERKFNPYHDEIGRFTSPPGVTVSYGRSGGPSDQAKEPSGGRRGHRAAVTSATTARGQTRRLDKATDHSSKPARDARGSDRSNPAQDIQTDAVRVHLGPPAPIASRFDLRIRQAGLDQMREELRSNPDPHVEKDLDELQRRLDAAEAWLDQADRVADREVLTASRTVIPPLDTAMSARSLFYGEGDLGDAINVASVVPIVGGVGKLARLALAARATEEAAGGAARIIQIGGAYRDLIGIKGYEVHHVPGKAVSSLSVGDGPAIAMLKQDHRDLVNSYNSKAGNAFRQVQSEHLARGDFAAAMQMDIDHIRSLFGGKYDESINQMVKYSREKGFIK